MAIDMPMVGIRKPKANLASEGFSKHDSNTCKWPLLRNLFRNLHPIDLATSEDPDSFPEHLSILSCSAEGVFVRGTWREKGWGLGLRVEVGGIKVRESTWAGSNFWLALTLDT